MSYTNSAASANRLLNKYGASATLRHYSALESNYFWSFDMTTPTFDHDGQYTFDQTKAFDPITGEVFDTTFTDYTITLAQFGLSFYKETERYKLDETEVERLKKFLIAPNAPVAPKFGDTIIFAGSKWEITFLDPISPDGVTAVLYKAYVKKLGGA